jgi:hypothetical protein
MTRHDASLASAFSAFVIEVASRNFPANEQRFACRRRTSRSLAAATKSRLKLSKVVP